jgi:hypothetical protein
MPVEKFVLVVSPTPAIAWEAANAVRSCGYTPVVVRSFAEGKRHLDAVPHLLVTELKLGEFNGLHLAIRAGVHEIPSVVISEQAFEQDVEQLGATWVSSEAAATGELQAALLRLAQGIARTELPYSWFEGERAEAEPSFATALRFDRNLH